MHKIPETSRTGFFSRLANVRLPAAVREARDKESVDASAGSEFVDDRLRRETDPPRDSRRIPWLPSRRF
jgi:hypothetical protein